MWNNTRSTNRREERQEHTGAEVAKRTATDALGKANEPSSDVQLRSAGPTDQLSFARQGAQIQLARLINLTQTCTFARQVDRSARARLAGLTNRSIRDRSARLTDQFGLPRQGRHIQLRRALSLIRGLQISSESHSNVDKRRQNHSAVLTNLSQTCNFPLRGREISSPSHGRAG